MGKIKVPIIAGLAIVCSACLLDGGQPTGSGGDHTTVIPVTTSGGDSAAAWVMVTALFCGVVALVVYGMLQRAARERSEALKDAYREMLVASGQVPMLNGRPYVSTANAGQLGGHVPAALERGSQ